MDDIAQICRTVRSNAGLFDATSLRVLEVSGADSKKLLHSLLSNDVEGVQPGFGNLAHLLDPKGKVQAACEMYVLPDFIWLVCDETSMAVLKKNITLRIFRSDVKIQDRSAAFAILGVYGPQSPALLNHNPLEKEYAHARIPFAGQEIFIARVHDLGEIGFRVVVEKTHEQAVVDALHSAGAIDISDEAFETLAMEAGMPRWGEDFTAENFSLEVNLNKAVSNSKGCYLGQEPVARLLSRGHVAQRLVGAVLEGNKDLQKGADVQSAGKTVGHVTRTRFSPTLGQTMVNAMLKYQFLEADNNAVEIAGHKARLVGLPYVNESGVNFLEGGPQAERVVGPQSRTKPKGSRG